MLLEEKLMEDYKQAMKNKEALRSSVLSFLRAGLKNFAIDKRKDKLSDEEVISVIKKQIKQRADSIEQFKKGNRMELAEKEAREQEILKSYLPKALPESQLRIIVDEVVSSLGEAPSMKLMGKVMKEVMTRAGASADGGLVSGLVKERLSSHKQE